MKVPQTKQFSDETAFVATNYYKATPDANAFGESIAQAQGHIAKSAADVADSVSAYRDRNERITAVDISNKIDDLRGKLLNDKENGYLNLNGSLASGKSQEYLAKFDEGVKNIMAEYKLFGPYRRAVDGIITSKKNSFAETVNSHDIKQTQVKNTDICNAALENNYNNFLANRNADNAFEKYDVDNNQILKIYAEQTHLGDEKIQLMKTSSRQKALQGAFEQFASDDNEDKIREYHKKYQQYFSPDTLSKIQTYITKKDNDKWADAESDRIIAIDNTEKEWAEIQKISDPAKRSTLQSAWANKRSMKEKIEREKFDDESRSTADRIMSLYGTEEEQLNQANNIEDTDKRDAVYRRIESANIDKRRLEKQKQDDVQKQFYENILSKEKSGTPLSFDDIPQGLSPEQELSCRRYIFQKTKSSVVATDNRVWEYLYKKQLNDAQNFAQVNLQDYKGYISDGEYKNFVKAQENIKKGGYYTDFNNKKINEAIDDTLKKIGANNHFGDWKNIDVNKDILSQLTREYESRHATKISSEKLEKLASSFGYKAQNSQKQVDKKIQSLYAERGSNLIKKLANDITYFESVNARFPNDKEIDDIVNANVKSYNKDVRNNVNRNIDFVQQRDQIMREISQTAPKKNYSKSLTYFENNVIPKWQGDLGVKITVVNGGTYRDYVKAGSSHHREVGDFSRAIDISTSEHNQNTKYELMRRAILSPVVQNIGTSDVNLLKSFPPSKYPKVVDERKYDSKNKTNHVHHMHLTLINDVAPNQLKVKK